jgi:hypothetical protein
MKKLLLVFIAFLALVSCETESLVVRNDATDNLVNHPSLVSKMKRVVQFPTTFDNMADHTSCFALNFPATILVNNQLTVVDSAGDYQQINNILNADDSDTDSVILQYPVGVTYFDYSQGTFDTAAALSAAAAGCEGSIELSCMTFGFPVSLSSYSDQQQVLDTFHIQGNAALFQFLQQLQNYDVVSLNYPANMVWNGVTTAIQDNAALEAFIDSHTADCEAAANPAPVDPGNTTLLGNIITQGNWHISYFFHSDDETALYTTYNFIFNANGTAIADSGSYNTAGTWGSYMENSNQIAYFTFEDDGLQELEEDWTITNINDTTVEMQRGNGGGTRYLTFQKN